MLGSTYLYSVLPFAKKSVYIYDHQPFAHLCLLCVCRMYRKTASFINQTCYRRYITKNIRNIYELFWPFGAKPLLLDNTLLLLPHKTALMYVCLQNFSFDSVDSYV